MHGRRPARFQLDPSLCATVSERARDLSGRVQALPRRFLTSRDTVAHFTAEQAVALGEAGRLTMFEANAVATSRAKTREGAAEEVRVRAAQLYAYATLLEDGEDGEDGEEEAMVTARVLLSLCEDPRPCGLVGVQWDSAALWGAVEKALWLRGGVNATRSVVSGSGLSAFIWGVDNVVTVAVLDSEGEAAESIEAEDVSVCVEGGSVVRVALSEAGRVEVVYTVAAGRVDAVTLSLRVCGTVLRGSPWTIPYTLCSGMLESVAGDTRAAFLRALTTEWLPGRGYHLLYRGSRDGMTAKAFHQHCDGKGPTLVLIRCRKGFVFGGYASASWSSPRSGSGVVPSPGGFLMSVVGPHGAPPLMFPIKTHLPLARRSWFGSGTQSGLNCHFGAGPSFINGLTVQANVEAPTEPFDDASHCVSIGNCSSGPSCGYENPHGRACLIPENGRVTTHFKPVEIEIFAVTSE